MAWAALEDFEALWETFDTRQRQLLPLPEPPPARLPLLPWEPLEPQLLLRLPLCAIPRLHVHARCLLLLMS